MFLIIMAYLGEKNKSEQDFYLIRRLQLHLAIHAVGVGAGDSLHLSYPTIPVLQLGLHITYIFRVIFGEEIMKVGVRFLFLGAVLLLLTFRSLRSSGGRWLWRARVQTAFPSGLRCDASHVIRSVPVLQELVEDFVLLLQGLAC